jgi:hypothetical protein
MLNNKNRLASVYIRIDNASQFKKTEKNNRPLLLYSARG